MEGAVRAVGTVAPGLAAQNLAPAGGASDTAPGPGRLPGDRPRRHRPGLVPRERPRTAGSPPMCQKRMFAAVRPTSPLRWPGQARPAAQLRSLRQPRAPLRAPPRPAPPRHVKGCLGVRGHSVTHGGGVPSMRASARAARAGLWRGWRHRGPGRPGALTSGWRPPLRRRPRTSRRVGIGFSRFPKTLCCSGQWHHAG